MTGQELTSSLVSALRNYASTDADDRSRRLIRTVANYVRREVDDVRQVLTLCATAGAGTPFEALSRQVTTARRRNTTMARQAIAHAGTEHIYFLLANADDAALAFRALAKEAPTCKITPLVAARTALESSAVFCYLLDPAIPVEERLLRFAAMRVRDLGNELTTARDLWAGGPSINKPPTVDPRSIQKRQLAIGKAIAAAQFSEVKDRNETVYALRSPQGYRARLNVNVFDLVVAYIPTAVPMWRIGSGGAHSQPWLLASELSPPDGPGPVAASWTAAALTFLLCGQAIVGTATTFSGVDGKRHCEKNMQRLGALALASGEANAARS